jgi:hypothetical protein
VQLSNAKPFAIFIYSRLYKVPGYITQFPGVGCAPKAVSIKNVMTDTSGIEAIKKAYVSGPGTRRDIRLARKPSNRLTGTLTKISREMSRPSGTNIARRGKIINGRIPVSHVAYIDPAKNAPDHPNRTTSAASVSARIR